MRRCYRDLIALSRRGDRTAHGLGGEPRCGPRTDLAAVAILRPPAPTSTASACCPSPAGRAEQPRPSRRGALRARPIRVDTRRPHPARRGRPMVQAGGPAPGRRSSSPRSPTTTATRASPRSSPRNRPTPCASTWSRSIRSSRPVGSSGARSPRSASAPTHRGTLEPAQSGQPSRRIEIILFTPQT